MVLHFVEKDCRFSQNFFQKLKYRRRSKLPIDVKSKHVDLSNGGLF